MLLIIGSMCALILTIVVYYKPKRRLSTIVSELILGMKYNVVASKDIVEQMLQARRNKTDLPLKPDKVAIVTGGSRGIGALITKMLLQCDMEVIIACRQLTAGEKTIQSIRKSGVTTGRAIVYELDNTSFASVRKFAEQIKRDYSKINILINNAGIMFTPYGETKDGFELQWQVNYLSHFLLTSLLLPLLKAGGLPNEKSRVINVSSCAHILGNLDFKNVNHGDEFITAAAYAQSKLAQVISTNKLQTLLKAKGLNVDVYSVHPGIVDTELFLHSYIHWYQMFLSFILKTPEQGATPIVYTAVNKDIEGQGGIYISNCQKCPVNPQALDESIQKQLHDVTLKHVGLNDFFENM